MRANLLPALGWGDISTQLGLDWLSPGILANRHPSENVQLWSKTTITESTTSATDLLTHFVNTGNQAAILEHD